MEKVYQNCDILSLARKGTISCSSFTSCCLGEFMIKKKNPRSRTLQHEESSERHLDQPMLQKEQLKELQLGCVGPREEGAWLKLRAEPVGQ